MNNLGKQFILDLKDCNRDVLDDLEFLKETLSAIVRQTHELPIGESFYQFTPQGVSGLVLGNGAHVCIHTWPEHNYAAMDIFTHNESFDLETASKLIIEKLGSRNPSITELAKIFQEESFTKFPTLGILAINLDIDSWKDIVDCKGEIDFFIVPKQFKYYMPKQIRTTLETN